MNWTDPAVIRDYVQGYFVHPDPKVWEPLADVLVGVTLSPDYPRWARSAAAAHDIPRATRVVIPECGHIPHLEVPDQFLGHLLPFLAR